MNARVVDWDALETAALSARRHAHAPYSRYYVGASLLTAAGHTYAGCNVENASYGLCLCAERTAVAKMVSAGDREPVALVVVTRGPVPAAPCGMCRQVLAEFAQELPIRLVVEGDPLATRMTSLGELLPLAFRGDALE